MSLDQLRGLLERYAHRDVSAAIHGIRLCMTDRGPETESGSSVAGTVLAVMAQGGKRLALGDQVHEYRAGQYLVASAALPVAGHVLAPPHGGPALAFGMTVEPTLVADLLLRAGPVGLPPAAGAPGQELQVSDAPADLLDAVVRLLRLLDHPRDRQVVAPLIKQEIVWRLLTSEQGATVRRIGLADSRLSSVLPAMDWIRAHYDQPLRVEEAARLSGLSRSAFHRNFKAATAMSPLQYQKSLRLQTARLLLATDPSDVTGAGIRVGYDSPSQFSREYKRLFGLSPRHDAVQVCGNQLIA